MTRPPSLSTPKKPFSDPDCPHWEMGYRVHGLWLGPDRIGYVGMKPKGHHDGIYTWDAGGEIGEAKGLVKAKKAVMDVLGIEGTPQRPKPLGQPWLEKILIRERHHAPEHAKLLSEKILAYEDPNNFGKPLTARRAYWRILDQGYLYNNMTMGWLKPDGTLLGCGHAAHDRLLDILGILVGDAERWGWIRIGEQRILHGYRATPQQLKFLKAHKLPFDAAADRLLPKIPQD